ncbi:hypothetical protein Cni_G21799 [Canna indica]|uniref:Bifunctional inhibitor/plant lipid transfer protein/seed storage helical domain-containing protein n=1 Tax=Canna indica TaxID=4628 RepID=A0AAQ3KQT3_9LILI|nr:hypothetical protein Cni_G21799 [Canna indica]
MSSDPALAAPPQETDAALLPRRKVVQYQRPCIPCAQGKGPLTAACCSGVKGLNVAAVSMSHRQAACSCIKFTVVGLKSLQAGSFIGIPGKCGVSIPYPISSSVDSFPIE